MAGPDRQPTSDDIGPLLAEWPYDDSQELMVRRVVGADGRERLQVRIELGVLEMHPSGRPDGARPMGYPSLLDYHLAQIEALEEQGDEYRLDHQDCLDLHREAMQFYQRRVSYLRLGDYAAAAADAEHNLAIMDLLRDHAADRADWLHSEQYRAFVIAHLARAKALLAVEETGLDRALAIVDEGIEQIKSLFRDTYQRPELIPESEEIRHLRELRQALTEHGSAVEERGRSDIERLEFELARAVEREDFEQAAALRDTLERLRGRAGSEL